MSFLRRTRLDGLGNAAKNNLEGLDFNSNFDSEVIVKREENETVAAAASSSDQSGSPGVGAATISSPGPATTVGAKAVCLSSFEQDYANS
jgi:hypothetical protein